MYPIKSKNKKEEDIKRVLVNGSTVNYLAHRTLWIFRCKTCNKEFESHRKKAQFCSKKCSNQYPKKSRYDDSNGKRFCSKCKRLLSPDAFCKRKTGNNKKMRRCKFCNSMHRSKWKFNLDDPSIYNLLNSQNWQCGICGKSIREYYDHPERINEKITTSISIDHINPNGNDIISNYQFTCKQCNTMKQNKNMEELYEWCKDVLEYRGLK